MLAKVLKQNSEERINSGVTLLYRQRCCSNNGVTIGVSRPLAKNRHPKMPSNQLSLEMTVIDKYDFGEPGYNRKDIWVLYMAKNCGFA